MDPQKLFRVLVVGGALLVGCREEELADGGAEADGGPLRDDGGVESDAPAAEADAGELMNCGLCPNPDCCVTEPSGESHERAGMMCCWGTSC